MLNDHIAGARSGQYNGGWSAGYTVQSVLLQLSSFLLESEAIPQDHGGVAQAARCAPWDVARTKREAREYECFCGHTHDKPWPQVGLAPGRDQVIALPRAHHIVKAERPIWSPAADGWIEQQQGDYLVRKQVASDGRVMQTLVRKRPPPAVLANRTIKPSTPAVPIAGEGFQYVTHPLAPSASTCRWFSQTDQSEVLPDDLVGLVLRLLPVPAVVHFGQTCSALAATVRRLCPLVERDLVCFHTKLSWREDVIGVGVKVNRKHAARGRKQPTMAPSTQVSAPLDLLSRTAFDELGVRLSVWKQRFDYFLPLALHPMHQQAVGTGWEEAMVDILGVSSGFDPMMVLDVLPCLMNSTIVKLVNEEDAEQQHASEAALLAYCAYHHVLLVLAQRYPQIAQVAEQVVSRFRDSPRARDKQHVPNLGELLVMLTLTDTTWDEIKAAYMTEAMARNVRWLLEKHPELGYLESHRSQYRVNTTCEASRTSQRLLMFQVNFLQLVGRPEGKGWTQVLQAYDQSFGQPSCGKRRQLHRLCKSVMGVESFHEFYRLIGVAVPPLICGVMRSAVRNSRRRRYHRPEQYRLEWNELVRRRSCEADRLEAGRQSTAAQDREAEAEWLRRCN